MGRVKTKKKIASKLTGKHENRIVELSLGNPDFGARRLVSMLKQEKIRVSSSQIYTILKRHGMQTRAKRLAKLKNQAKKTESLPKKVIPKIPDETVQRIVEASLQNPDYGARRLASLLKEKKIFVSASSVYTI